LICDAHLFSKAGTPIQSSQQGLLGVSGLKQRFFERHDLKLLYRHSVAKHVPEKFGQASLPLNYLVSRPQLYFVQEKGVEIRRYRARSAYLCPMPKGVSLVPASIGILVTVQKFPIDSLNGPHYSTSGEIFTKTLVSENKRRITAGTLAVLAKEEGSQEPCHTSLGPLLKNLQ
jgi:hypothetical protein